LTEKTIDVIKCAMTKTETKIHNEIDEITGAGVEEAVIDFFDGANLTLSGVRYIGNKRIEVIQDKEKQVLSAIATVDGVDRAVIKSYLYAAYFRLQGEEDANGVRDDVVYNRGIYGGGSIDLFRGPGVDLSQKKLARTQAERLEIAKRLGIELDVSQLHRTRILK